MVVYKKYPDLAESTLLDQGIVALGRKSWLAVGVISLLSGAFSSILPILSLLIRPYVTDIGLRRILAWRTIIWRFMSGVPIWLPILITIELVREGLRYGLPFLMKWVGNKLNRDPVAETFVRRLCRLVRQVSQQSPVASMTQILACAMSFRNNNASEPFTDEQWEKFKKLFICFDQTCFVIEPMYKSATIFFPSFVFRMSPQGVQVTSDDAVELIRSDTQNKENQDKETQESIQNKGNIQDEEEKCVICMNPFSDISVKLQCGHRFCLNCIFSWLNQEYTCPCCRSTVN